MDTVLPRVSVSCFELKRGKHLPNKPWTALMQGVGAVLTALLLKLCSCLMAYVLLTLLQRKGRKKSHLSLKVNINLPNSGRTNLRIFE